MKQGKEEKRKESKKNKTKKTKKTKAKNIPCDHAGKIYEEGCISNKRKVQRKRFLKSQNICPSCRIYSFVHTHQYFMVDGEVSRHHLLREQTSRRRLISLPKHQPSVHTRIQHYRTERCIAARQHAPNDNSTICTFTLLFLCCSLTSLKTTTGGYKKAISV